MRRTIRLIAFALAALFITAACTPEELALYLHSTTETRHVLSADELQPRPYHLPSQAAGHGF